MSAVKVQKALRHSMTVAKLIEVLKRMPPDAVPGFVIGYGDHTRTQQFLPVDDVRPLEDNEVVCETAYSNSGLCVREVGEGDDRPDGVSGEAVVLML